MGDPAAQAGVCVVKKKKIQPYKYTGLGRTGPGDHVALVVVLAVGEDREELENRELGLVDETIQVALPYYVLEGPYVCEEWR